MRGGEYNPHENGQNYEGSPNGNYDGEGSYESDGVTKKLVGSRVARKRAEEDVKLLANRIALLKLEEQKVSINPILLTSLLP